MVMRHFGGGIGHLSSPYRFEKDEKVISEIASVDNCEDEEPNINKSDGADDIGDLDNDSIGSVSSADEDLESDLHTDDNGYDSL